MSNTGPPSVSHAQPLVPPVPGTPQRGGHGGGTSAYDEEMASAVAVLREAGMERAAAALARDWAGQARAARKSTKRGVWVRLAQGGPAFLDAEKVKKARAGNT
jgi:hypothetical protein